MPPRKQMILVTGATGQQGGAVARRLLERSFPVRALTRNPQQPAARRLAEQGTEVVQGDLNEPASLPDALDGAYGIFSVQDFKETGVEGEIRQGTALADAAKSAGVRHFVYSSVASADRDTGIPHFESKWQVEQHVRRIDLPRTILRPVFFMENWQNLAGDSILHGTLAQPLPPDTRLQQIAVDDIGAFAAIAFENPDAWLGREEDLAGDERTMRETARALGHALDRDVQYVQLSKDEFRDAAGEEMTLMYEWFEEVGYDVNIPALRKEHPALQTFEEYLRTHRWEPAA